MATADHKPVNIPLVMVPGWLDHERNLTWMATYLRQEGLDPHLIVPRPNNGSAPIELLAQQVARFVEQEFGPEQRINLFGFSMGGLISRVYIQKLGGQQRVQRLVTVASPHRGTVTAHLFPGPAAQQMRPNSSFLADLNGDLSALAAIQFTSIWTPFDFMIVPAANSELPIGRMIKVMSPAHGVMLYDRRIWRAVQAALTDSY